MNQIVSQKQHLKEGHVGHPVFRWDFAEGMIVEEFSDTLLDSGSLGVKLPDSPRRCKMAELKYQPISHDHEAFLKKALRRKEFKKTYDELGEEYTLVRQMLAARSQSGLTQGAVAERMGTTKSAVSRLEAAGKHAPSLTTLKKYAKAVGCNLEIKLVPTTRLTKHSTGRARKMRAG